MISLIPGKINLTVTLLFAKETNQPRSASSFRTYFFRQKELVYQLETTGYIKGDSS
jgi:hypothetical protein